MTKHKEFENYCYKLIKKYQKILLLDKYTIKLNPGCKNSNSLMECKFNYPYLNVIINYSNSIIDKWQKKEDIIPYLVHEMCHPITDPLYDKAISRFVGEYDMEDERERLTDYICNIVIKNNL